MGEIGRFRKRNQSYAALFQFDQFYSISFSTKISNNRHILRGKAVSLDSTIHQIIRTILMFHKWSTIKSHAHIIPVSNLVAAQIDLFFCSRWLKDLFRLGLQKSLSPHDVYTNLKENDAAMLTDRLQTEWKKEINREGRKPRILNVIWRVFVSKIIGFSFLYSILDIFLR